MAGYTCGDNYEGAMGTIHSENFPNNYDNDMICLYTITVPDGVVLLNFTEIDVYKSYILSIQRTGNNFVEGNVNSFFWLKAQVYHNYIFGQL